MYHLILILVFLAAFFQTKLSKSDIELFPSQIIIGDMDNNEKKSMVKHARRNNTHLCIDLLLNVILLPDNESSRNPLEFDLGAVLSLLIVPQQLSLIVGLLDGRMILYNLCNLQAYHLAHPPEIGSPLVKLAYIEPEDDPRACIYIWAMHSNGLGVMHSVTFERKIIDESFTVDGYNVHQNFQTCCVRFTMDLIEDKGCSVVGLQQLSRNSVYGEEEDVVSMFAISYDSLRMQRSVLLLFDLNQWYKEQMPRFLKITEPSISFVLYKFGDKQLQGLDVWMDSKSVIPFESIQRPEEHFYPNSFSFESFILSDTECSCFTWMGMQNNTLNTLKDGKSLNIYAPDTTFSSLMKAALIPRFWDELNESRAEISVSSKRELIFAIALEYNCIGVLRDCIKSWSDGSYLTQKGDGVFLSTVTDWIWKYSNIVIHYCDAIVTGLFDYSDRLIDYRTKKNLGQCTKELKILSELLDLAIKEYKLNIPEEVSEQLLKQFYKIKQSHDYLEIIQWLVNTGILPEGNFISYPREMLQNYYTSQRYKFRQLDRDVRMSAACRYLYIDTFIQNECNAKDLLVKWKSSYGMYPPTSIRDLLEIMSVTKISNETKYSIILYFFLDLTEIISSEDLQQNLIDVLIKFPSVFKLSPSIIKRTQAFWKFDHGFHELALDELFSPIMCKNDVHQWECEFMIESLLIQDHSQLALRVMRSQGSCFINPLLEMQTLLRNNCVSEAFQIQRIKGDPNLLKIFFKTIFSHGKWDRLLDLALSEKEGDILCEYLNEVNSSNSQNFHIVYLLQRQNFVEASKLIEKLNQRRNTLGIFDRPKLILSTYNTTVSPAIGEISKSYFSFSNSNYDANRNNITAKVNEEPFSSQLIRSSFNLPLQFHKKTFDSIGKCKYDKSFLSANERETDKLCSKIPFLTKPFSSRHSATTESDKKLIIPTIIDKTGKRKQRIESDFDDRPKKRFFNENDYKAKLLTTFKDKRGYDFTNSIENWVENKSNRKFEDTIFKFSSDNENAREEVIDLSDENMSETYINETDKPVDAMITESFDTVELHMPDERRVTAEMWNSESKEVVGKESDMESDANAGTN